MEWGWERKIRGLQTYVKQLQAEVERLKNEVEQLRGALKPLDAFWEVTHDNKISFNRPGPIFAIEGTEISFVDIERAHEALKDCQKTSNGK